MRRVIGIDIHRAFGEVVFWEGGKLRCAGWIDMTRTALEGFGKSLLATDEVVIEATGNCMSVSRVLSPFVKRVVIANPLQVRAIAHAHVNTDKVGAGTLATRRVICPRYGPRKRLPNGCDGWSPGTTRSCGTGRGSITRCTRSCTHHLIPRCSHADLFNQRSRDWLARQPLPDDEQTAVERHVRELDRLGEDLAILDREIAQSTLDIQRSSG